MTTEVTLEAQEIEEACIKFIKEKYSYLAEHSMSVKGKINKKGYTFDVVEDINLKSVKQTGKVKSIDKDDKKDLDDFDKLDNTRWNQ